MFVLSWSHLDDFYCDEIQVYQEHVEHIVLKTQQKKKYVFISLIYIYFLGNYRGILDSLIYLVDLQFN